MDYLVVGLGNPGPEYEQTRHNVGFMCIDELASRHGASYWKHEGGSLTSSVRMVTHSIEGVARAEVLFVKPQTFMNNSGTAVARLARDYKVAPEHIIVVHDELDIPESAVRCKFDGGHGGHNGQRSIIAKLGSSAYPRVRAGIGRPPGRMDAAAFVLAPMRGAALEELKVTAAVCADAVERIIDEGFTKAQNSINTSEDS